MMLNFLIEDVFLNIHVYSISSLKNISHNLFGYLCSCVIINNVYIASCFFFPIFSIGSGSLFYLALCFVFPDEVVLLEWENITMWHINGMKL